MADDMANGWGTTLVHLRKTRGKKRGGGGSEIMHDEFDFTNFNDTIRKDTYGRFFLCKATPNGSDANLYAVTAITGGNNDGLLIAAGSYVAGDYGPLHAMSTAKFSISDGPSFIQKPVEVESDFTRNRIAGLPYHIPKAIVNEYDRANLRRLEDGCFLDLHHRLLTRRMKGQPITCLLLELVLANNGAELSNRALTILGKLAAHHSFKVVVDEIMTGGRTGIMLYLSTKPKIFYESVAYVTLGKWPKMGLVLSSRHQHSLDMDRLQRMSRRGQSTSIECDNAEALWKIVMEELPYTDTRRAAALRKLDVKEEDAWGPGILIFAPVKRLSPGTGTLARFLPMLEDTPFDSIRVQRKNVPWDMHSVNKTIMEQCQSWLEKEHWTTYEDIDLNLLACHTAQLPAGYFFTTREIREECLCDENRHTIKVVAKILRKAEEAGMIAKVQKDVSRTRGWEVQEYCYKPWLE